MPTGASTTPSAEGRTPLSRRTARGPSHSSDRPPGLQSWARAPRPFRHGGRNAGCGCDRSRPSLAALDRPSSADRAQPPRPAGRGSDRRRDRRPRPRDREQRASRRDPRGGWRRSGDARAGRRDRSGGGRSARVVARCPARSEPPPGCGSGAGPCTQAGSNHAGVAARSHPCTHPGARSGPCPEPRSHAGADPDPDPDTEVASPSFTTTDPDPEHRLRAPTPTPTPITDTGDPVPAVGAVAATALEPRRRRVRRTSRREYEVHRASSADRRASRTIPTDIPVTPPVPAGGCSGSAGL